MPSEPAPGRSRGRAGAHGIPVAALMALCASSPAAAACAGTPGSSEPPRFAVAGAEARDLRTGLVWQRCSVGTRWTDGAGCVGTKGALMLDAARRAAAAAGNGWRLPDVSELAGLMDEGCGGPFLDPAVFSDLASTPEGDAPYWTATPIGAAGLFYYVDVGLGLVDGHSAGYAMAVRLVRAGS